MQHGQLSYTFETNHFGLTDKLIHRKLHLKFHRRTNIYIYIYIIWLIYVVVIIEPVLQEKIVVSLFMFFGSIGLTTEYWANFLDIFIGVAR